MLDKKTIRKNFSKHAKHYDFYADIQRQAAKALTGILPVCKAKNILEIGCGTGIFTEFLLKKYPPASICAIDFSSAMVNLAKKKINKIKKRAAAKSRVKFMVADAEKIKLTQKFDLICSNSCFQWFASPHKTIKKYWAKLASGGHLVFSVFGPKTYQELQIALKLFYPHPPRTAAAKFLNKNHWQQLLTKLGGGTTIKEIKLKEKYPFLLDLLKTIKYTGTRGEGLGNLTLSRRQLSRLEEIYKAKFGKIVATHQIFYCRAKKIAPCS